MRLANRNPFGRSSAAARALELPEAVFKTCPWQPRELVATGLRQWLRCCAAALRDDQIIGMPSRAVDEAWHGLILCTARYATFCDRAYGRFLHHHPEGGAPDDVAARADAADDQLRRTVVAWSLVARPNEQCVLWDLDLCVGVEQPWGIDAARVAAIEGALTALAANDRRFGSMIRGYSRPTVQKGVFRMPNPIDVQKVLSGATYPSSKHDLIEHAKNNGADDEIVNSLQKLPDGEISGPDQVQKAVF